MPNFEELERYPDAELVRQFNSHAARSDMGAGFWRDEIARRRLERQTAVIRWLTIVITILTAANVGFVVYSVFK